MNLSGPNLWSGATTYLWVLIRIAGLFTVAPIFGTQFVPVRVRVGLALVLAWLVGPLVTPATPVDPLTPAGLVVTAHEVTVGLAMGLVMRAVFGALEMAGQVVSMPMGLGFAALVDPATGVQLPLLSHFYTILATLVFLALNGHLMLLQMLVESFHTLPIGGFAFGTAKLWVVAGWGGHLFSGALLVALPAVTALLVVNLTFGVITRSAPQLNIFAVGFPISLTLGFVIILASLPALTPQVIRLIELGFRTLDGLTAASS
jgi:flagellar biosynthetic protein FliR